MNENGSRTQTTEADVDPRRAMWRRGSYEIVGDWIRPASLALLDRLAQAIGDPADRSLLDVATGTGAVAIEAARRGASVTALDLTDELVVVARRRADEAGVAIRWAIGDFDRLDDAIGADTFEIVTSSFGVIFAPDASATASGLVDRLESGGWLAVTAWDPDGPMMVPGSILELLPERPPMPDLAMWAIGIDRIFEHLPVRQVGRHVDVLEIEFESAALCAEQFERWAGGWAQLFEYLDAVGNGEEARQRFVEHLSSFGTPSSGSSFVLRAGYHTNVLQRHDPERR